MLIKLTHPEPNYDLWVHYDEIVVMERYSKVKSVIITDNMDKPDVTALVLKNGRTMGCKETPEQINALIVEAKTKDLALGK